MVRAERSRRERTGIQPVAWLLVVALATVLLRGTVAAQENTPTPHGTTPAGAASALLVTPFPLPEGTPRVEGPLSVVTTTTILADLARQVGGPRVEVRSLLPIDADAHDYEPAPADVAVVEDAAVVVTHGLGLDAWADDLIANADMDAPVVVATEGVPTLTSEQEGFGDGDPHVWFDPTRVATMVGTIAAALTAVDPDGAGTYDARTRAYQQQLAALDTTIKTAIGTIPPERRKLVTNHEALAYYADRYGLTIVGTVIPGLDTTAEPSAEEINELLDAIEREAVPANFAEASANPELARELADQAGVALVPDLRTESLGDPGSGAETYLGLMRTNTVLIVEALTGSRSREDARWVAVAGDGPS